MSKAEAQLAALMQRGPKAPVAAHNTAAPKMVAVPTLRDGDIHLGDTAAGIKVGMDLAKLVDGRLLIQGNSGAGKSMLLRRLFEQAFGMVQQLLVDLDGEFSTLSESFDVAVLTAADVQRVGCKSFAFHLRENRYSAVLDLSDATSEDQLSIVADLANGLLAVPEQHWFPLLVEIDEAQKVAPHYDTGDIEPETRKRAIAALADLMGRGRKRGIAGVIATQRLSETAKAVAAKATNIVVGRTFLDRDVDRAGSLLGFTAGQARPLRTLTDGEFICLGPAIAGPTRIRFRAGTVQSSHKGRSPAIVQPPKITAAESVALLGALPPALAPTETKAAKATKDPNEPSGRRGRHWTAEQDQIIRDGYAKILPLAEIGEELAKIGCCVATSGISSRAHALGLASANASVGWADREDEIVRDAYEREVRIIDICGLLDKEGFKRGRVAVQMRAIALGITRDRVNYWTEPEKAIAITGLESGKPYREIVAELRDAGFERGMTSIMKFAQKNNYNRAGESWTLDQTAKLRELYEKRVPVKEIADRLGKTVTAIRARASNLGMKQRTPWTEMEYETLRAAHEDGKSLGDAATLIGRPYPNVARVAADLGLNFKANRNVVAQESTNDVTTDTRPARPASHRQKLKRPARRRRRA